MADSATTRDGLTLHPQWQSTTAEEHSLDGQPWIYRYLRAQYNKGRMTVPPGVCLSVTLAQPFNGSVAVFPEDRWDRFVRSIGLSREFQTGTPDVDARFMLSGVVDDALARVVQSPGTHRSLQELFALGFTRVEFFDSEVRAICRPWTTNLPDAEPPPALLDAAAALIRLKAEMVNLAQGPPTAGSRFHHFVASPRPAAWMLGGVLASIACALVLLTTSPLQRGDSLGTLGGPALGAALAAVVAVAIVSRRYAFRGRTLIAFFFAVAAIMSTASLAALGILNESLDNGPSAEHTGTIVQKSKHAGKSTTYHIIVGSWRADHGYEDFTLAKEAWDTVRPGASTYTVHSKPGRFGVEWIVDRTLHP